MLDLLPPKVSPKKEDEEKKGKKKGKKPSSKKKTPQQIEQEEKTTKMKYDFVAVNSVFRCNRFAPGMSLIYII